MARPAFAPSSISGEKRIVAPLDPPAWSEVSFLSKVPDACHARRMVKGQTLALVDLILEDISERIACSPIIF